MSVSGDGGADGVWVVMYLKGFVAVSGLWLGSFFGAHGLVAGVVSR